MCVVCIVFGKDYRQYTFRMGSHSSNKQRWSDRMGKVLVLDPLMWLFTVTVSQLHKDDSYLSHGGRERGGRQWIPSPCATSGEGDMPPSPLATWQFNVHKFNSIQLQLWKRHSNGEQSQEILHHLGTQKDAKLCLKCTKIRLAAGLCPDPLLEL